MPVRLERLVFAGEAGEAGRLVRLGFAIQAHQHIYIYVAWPEAGENNAPYGVGNTLVRSKGGDAVGEAVRVYDGSVRFLMSEVPP